MPARVHSGPSVETPIIERDAVDTPLRVIGDKPDWFAVFNPKTAASGWVYWRYLGAILGLLIAEAIGAAGGRGRDYRPKPGLRSSRYALAIAIMAMATYAVTTAHIAPKRMWKLMVIPHLTRSYKGSLEELAC